MGLDRGRQTGVLGFFLPSNHSDTPRARSKWEAFTFFS